MTNRIVTLAPGATEIILFLKHEDELVGRSHLCDMSPKVRTLPKVTEAGTAGEECRVLYDTLKALEPTLIITPYALEPLDLKGKPIIVTYAPESFAEITSAIADIGDRLRDPDPATKVVGRFTGKAATVSMKTLMIPQRPRIACIEYVDPLTLGGLWVPEMIETAGGIPVLIEKGEPSKQISLDELNAADPDILLFHLRPADHATSSLATLLQRPEWQAIRAIKEGKAAITKPHLFNRPGPRLAEGVEVLGEVLHPGKFGTEHQGRLWSWV